MHSTTRLPFGRHVSRIATQSPRSRHQHALRQGSSDDLSPGLRLSRRGLAISMHCVKEVHIPKEVHILKDAHIGAPTPIGHLHIDFVKATIRPKMIEFLEFASASKSGSTFFLNCWHRFKTPHRCCIDSVRAHSSKWWGVATDSGPAAGGSGGRTVGGRAAGGGRRVREVVQG